MPIQIRCSAGILLLLFLPQAIGAKQSVMSPFIQTNLEKPRAWLPNELRIERSVPETVREELARRGHTLKVVDSLGACQAVGKLKDGPAFEGSHDPRVSDGAAAGL
jgi:hypothetical protein